MLAIVISKNESMKERIGKMLEGYEVIECKDFLEAVSTISEKQKEIRIVFADYNLNPYSGVELLRTVKKIKKTIRTVLLVSRADEEAEIAGLRSDIDLVMDYEKTEAVNKAYVEKMLERRIEEAVYVRGMELIANGEVIELTRIDMQIVSLLIDRANKVVRREEILEEVWGQSEKSSDAC